MVAKYPPKQHGGKASTRRGITRTAEPKRFGGKAFARTATMAKHPSKKSDSGKVSAAERSLIDFGN
jgi:hypothetical protein